MTWRETTLGQIVELQRGHDLTEQERNAGNIPVIGSAGQNGWHDRARAKGPGVTIGRSGASIGVVTYTKCDYWPHNTVLYAKDFKGNDPAFVAQLLRCIDLAALNSGSAQPSLNRNFVYPIKVRVPEPEDQQRIAGILSAYDDLIEVNRRRIAILEDMARRLFDEWFVHFRYPGHEAVPLVETEFGPAPQCWKPRQLSFWADEIRNTVLPSDIDPATPYVGLEHLPRRSTTLIESGRAGDVGSAKLKYQSGDILFGKIRPYFHKVGYTGHSGVCSTDAIVIRAKNSATIPYVLGLVSSDPFVAHSVTTSNGTKMPRADWKVLRSYPLFEPQIDVLDQYCRIIQPSVENAAILAAQNARLRAARDLLLPKLIFGEIGVSVADLAQAAE